MFIYAHLFKDFTKQKMIYSLQCVRNAETTAFESNIQCTPSRKTIHERDSANTYFLTCAPLHDNHICEPTRNALRQELYARGGMAHPGALANGCGPFSLTSSSCKAIASPGSM